LKESERKNESIVPRFGALSPGSILSISLSLSIRITMLFLHLTSKIIRK
jgi:hypothetical protein